jgi:hypothetical protein
VRRERYIFTRRTLLNAMRLIHENAKGSSRLRGVAARVLAEIYIQRLADPADRAAAMIEAFAQTLTDPAFLADAAKIRLSLDPLTGEEIMRLLDAAHAAPKDVIERAAKFSVVN